jgi:hypothetical protein
MKRRKSSGAFARYGTTEPRLDEVVVAVAEDVLHLDDSGNAGSIEPLQPPGHRMPAGGEHPADPRRQQLVGHDRAQDAEGGGLREVHLEERVHQLLEPWGCAGQNGAMVPNIKNPRQGTTS